MNYDTFLKLCTCLKHFIMFNKGLFRKESYLISAHIAKNENDARKIKRAYYCYRNNSVNIQYVVLTILALRWDDIVLENIKTEKMHLKEIYRISKCVTTRDKVEAIGKFMMNII